MICERCGEGFPCPDCDSPRPIQKGDRVEVRLAWPLYDRRELDGILVKWAGEYVEIAVEDVGLIALRWTDHTIRAIKRADDE